MNNTADLIKNGLVTAVNYDYRTSDGVMIRRVSVGRYGTTTKWLREDDKQLYRSLYEAYYRISR